MRMFFNFLLFDLKDSRYSRRDGGPTMANKLKLVSGATPKASLVYGMRVFKPDQIARVSDAEVQLVDGSTARITMHLIEGTRAQMRRQLEQSVDAFFELLNEELTK